MALLPASKRARSDVRTQEDCDGLAAWPKGTRNQAIDEELPFRVRQELVSLATHLPLTSDECGQDALNRLCDFARIRLCTYKTGRRCDEGYVGLPL
jgi:hypothetical protein